MNAATCDRLCASWRRRRVESESVLLLLQGTMNAPACDRFCAPRCRSRVENQRILFPIKRGLHATAGNWSVAARRGRAVEGERILLPLQGCMNSAARNRLCASGCGCGIKCQLVLFLCRRIRVRFEPCVDDVKIAVQHIDIYKVASFRLGQPIISCPGRHPDHPLLCLDMGVLRTAIGNIALKQLRELLLHFLVEGPL